MNDSDRRVLGGHIANFSAASAVRGLIPHTAVTIGCDAPLRTMHELLLRTGDRTAHVLRDPTPFVLQTALNDFVVTYEISA